MGYCDYRKTHARPFSATRKLSDLLELAPRGVGRESCETPLGLHDPWQGFPEDLPLVDLGDPCQSVFLALLVALTGTHCI